MHVTTTPAAERQSVFVIELNDGDELAFRSSAGGVVDASRLRIVVEHKSGRRTRVRVHAPLDVLISRVRKLETMG